MKMCNWWIPSEETSGTFPWTEREREKEKVIKLKFFFCFFKYNYCWSEYEGNMHALAAHLSPPAAAARTRRTPPWTARSLRRLFSSDDDNSQCSDVSNFPSSFLLHGCQVAPTLAGMHMSEIGPCNTVSSSDINPSSISSASYHIYPAPNKFPNLLK